MLFRAEGFYAATAVTSPPSILGAPVWQSASGDVNPRTFSYTLEAGADGLIVIASNDTSDSPVSATWTATGAAGQAMTALTLQAQTATSIRMFYLASPNFGTNSGEGVASVTLSDIGPAHALPISIGGWSGAAPVEAGAAGTSQDPAALAIDPDPNSVIIHGVVSAIATTNVTFDGAQTLINAVSSSGWGTAASYKQVTSGAATTVDHAWGVDPVRRAEVVAAFAA